LRGILESKMNLFRNLKNNIKKRRFIFWSLFHPDNLFKFKYANKAENITWEFIKKEMGIYKSLCEIGCFNGKVILIMRQFLKNKIYIGYDLNIFAIITAKILNYFYGDNKNFFYCQNGFFSANKSCELFISTATIIYFSEKELKRYIELLKINKSFKALLIHEIFINEEILKKESTLIDENLNIHSISMIKKEFGNNYSVETYRTFYPQWESNDRISAILCIKRV